MVENRGGTNQTARAQAALQPESALIDERSLRDMLRFALEYAKELVYFDVDGHVPNPDVDNWSGFLGDDLDAIIDFLDNPTPGSRYAQPHVALFLTFLKLLRHAQDQMNGLTRRHLDYYYREVLRLTPRPPIPDNAHVVVTPTSNVQAVTIPADTLLNAGADRQYRTTEPITVNQAQAVDFRTLHAEWRRTGIIEARENREVPKQQAFVDMLRIVYGAPQPGDNFAPLPAGSTLPPLPADQSRYQNIYAYLQDVARRVNLVRAQLYMSLPTLRALIRLKQQQGEPAQAKWTRINAILTEVGRRRDPRYTITARNAQDFDGNLARALGLSAPPDFRGVPDVTNIYELYAQPRTETVLNAINEFLKMSPGEFYALMDLKTSIDADWTEIYRILRQAGRARLGVKALTDFAYNRHAPPPDFNASLATALGEVKWNEGGAQDIDNLNAQLESLQTYFHMLPEQFGYVMAIEAKGTAATDSDWDTVYTLLDTAYRDRVTAERRSVLQSFPKTEAGVTHMLNYAAGFDLDTDRDDAVAQLERFGKLDVGSQPLAAALQNPAAVAAGSWTAIYNQLEAAMRLIVPLPTPQRVEWRNLYPDANATSVLTAGALSWETFGRPHFDGVPAPSFGWAIRSPLLSLSAGRRVITLTITFETYKFDASAVDAVLKPESPFVVQVSTEKGWIEPTTQTITRKQTALSFMLEFNDQVDTLAPYPDDAFARESTALRIMLRQFPSEGGYVTRYEPFRDLNLQSCLLTVDVFGLIPAQMQNDQGSLTPNKPFDPFGTNAIAGARFYVGHPELIDKPITRLNFHVEWMGAPANLLAHYANYPAITNTTVFTVAQSVVDRGVARATQNAPLFNNMTNAAAQNDLVMSGLQVPTLPRDAVGDLLTWNRYLQWELQAPGFQQDTYPRVAAQKAAQMALEIATGKVARDANDHPILANYQVNPPYTPRIKTLTFDYSAAAALNLGDSIFHIQPFGYAPINPAEHGFPFLPAFDLEGELYIGLSGVRAPQDIALLFQLAEDTPNPDAPPPPIQWSYLSGNRWLSLAAGGVLADTTMGLLKSGIIRFMLPHANPNTLLPSPLYWLRAALPYNTDGVCSTVGIQAQAITVVLHAGDVLPTSLPAGSITELSVPLSGVESIAQLYPSFGSRVAEPDSQFYTRVSERLRHKERALTMWDYEHLVLDHFPQIYRVKCLPAADEPGVVHVIVIPNLRSSLRFDPFAPQAPVSTLRAIEAFLKTHTSAFSRVRVSNAHYVPVKIRLGVRFMPGVNETHYRQRLNDEINRFLSPWAYDYDADIVIGSRIYANALVNFIEQRDYVDYVAEIRLFRRDEEGRPFAHVPPAPDGSLWVEPLRADGVLVATPQHEIDTLVDDRIETRNFEGINYMKIELDFIIGPREQA